MPLLLVGMGVAALLLLHQQRPVQRWVHNRGFALILCIVRHAACAQQRCLLANLHLCC